MPEVTDVVWTVPIASEHVLVQQATQPILLVAQYTTIDRQTERETDREREREKENACVRVLHTEYTNQLTFKRCSLINFKFLLLEYCIRERCCVSVSQRISSV
jgi:hypothetical protein